MGAPASAVALQDQKEKRIHRQTASKVAGILLGYLPKDEQNMATLLTLSDWLVKYYEEGRPAPETLDQLMGRAMPPGTEGPPPGDDEIPF